MKAQGSATQPGPLVLDADGEVTAIAVGVWVRPFPPIRSRVEYVSEIPTAGRVARSISASEVAVDDEAARGSAAKYRQQNSSEDAAQTET